MIKKSIQSKSKHKYSTYLLVGIMLVVVLGFAHSVTYIGQSGTGDNNFNDGALFIENSTGRVGIGTTNPTYKIHALDDTDHVYITAESDGANKSAYFRSVTPTEDWYLGFWEQGNVFRIRDHNRGIDRMVIDDLGYVGIGTTNPSAELEIKSPSGSSDLIINTNGLDLDSTIYFKEADNNRWILFNDGNSGDDFKFLNLATSNTAIEIQGSTDRVLFADLTAAGSDPLCWDGAGSSFIGDCSSLSKYKNNIQYLNPSYSWLTTTYDKLKPARYTWKPDYVNATKQIENCVEDEYNNTICTSETIINEVYDKEEYGLLADDIATVHPALAGYDKDGNVKNVRWFNLITFNVLTLKSVIAKQIEQEARLDSIEADLCNQGLSKYC